MDLMQSLESLGLGKRESRVYLALLQIGSTTTSKLIRRTGIASSKIYDILEKLIHRGLVSFIIQRGKREFHAISPEKILDIIREKEDIIKEAMPKLQQLFKKSNEEITAEIYKGREGAKTIFEDILKEGKEFLILGASGKGITTLPYYLPHFYKKSQKKQISTKILFVDNEENRKQAIDLDKYKNAKIKFLPKQIRNLMVVFIYSSRVVIIPIYEGMEETPLAILIKSKQSADSYRDYFNWIWDICK